MWESGITEIKGEVRNGGTIRIHTSVDNRSYRRRVEQVPGEAMTWTRGLPLGLFNCVRTFTRSSQGAMTHLRVREEASGPLSVLMGKTGQDGEDSFAGYIRQGREAPGRTNRLSAQPGYPAGRIGTGRSWIRSSSSGTAPSTMRCSAARTPGRGPPTISRDAPVLAARRARAGATAPLSTRKDQPSPGGPRHCTRPSFTSTAGNKASTLRAGSKRHRFTGPRRVPFRQIARRVNVSTYQIRFHRNWRNQQPP